MKLIDISVSYGEKKVFTDFSICFPDEKITCVLGASGCGKTTLLGVLSGSVPFSGKSKDLPEDVSYIFQDPTLVPSMTVEQNVEFVLKSKIKDKKLRKKLVSDMLESVGLGKEKKSYPHTLSGGMAQRVSLARAFSYPAKCMLMDEPFKGLDVPLKKQMMTLFSSLYAASPKTTVFVTHDIDEALLLGDRIILLTNNGILGEFSVDTPRENRTLTDLASLKEELFDLL